MYPDFLDKSLKQKAEGELGVWVRWGEGFPTAAGARGKPGQLRTPGSLLCAALLPALPPTAHPHNPREKTACATAMADSSPPGFPEPPPRPARGEGKGDRAFLLP